MSHAPLLTETISNNSIIVQLDSIHLSIETENVWKRKLSSAINIYLMKAENIWNELLLYTRFVDPDSSAGRSLYELIAKISNHGFHSSSQFGCPLCSLLGPDQRQNKKFLMAHYRLLTKQIVMQSLDSQQRIILVLKTEDLTKLIFTVACIMFCAATLMNNIVKFLEDAEQDKRNAALFGIVEFV